MVVDPLSLSVLGGVALGEGIKFLYAQATELLKRRREQGEGRDSAAATTEELVRQQPQVLDGPLVSGQVRLDVVAERESELRELRSGLADYADGLADVDPTDVRLLKQVASLRALLELAYGQHLTFQGEGRPATGTGLSAEAASQANTYAARVTASGAGAIAVGRDVSGNITTTMHNDPPASR